MVTGTKLLWVDNTDSDLFLSSDSSMFYYLVSGRWFRAASLDGPWSFATLDLPDELLALLEHRADTATDEKERCELLAEAARLAEESVQRPDKAAELFVRQNKPSRNATSCSRKA
mgnify:CR=1 FL=1